MITPLKKHPGQHGGLVAILLLAATTTVVWATHPRGATSSTTAPASALGPANQRAAPSPGAIAALPPHQAPPVEQPKTVVVDDRAPVIATGSTDYDETRTSHVGVPVSGWLKKTRTMSLGRTVRSGETLGIVYSLDVYLTTASVVEQVRNYRGQAPLDAERWRLLRWGMLQPTLARIEKTLTPQAALPLIARVPGTVVAEAGAPAQPVEPSAGLELFTVTDPAYVWVFVDVPDAYAARLAVGTPARLAIEGVARPVRATVAHVYRYSDDGMRKVRFELYSPRPIIKPNLPVTAELQLDARRPRP